MDLQSCSMGPPGRACVGMRPGPECVPPERVASATPPPLQLHRPATRPEATRPPTPQLPLEYRCDTPWSQPVGYPDDRRPACRPCQSTLRPRGDAWHMTHSIGFTATQTTGTGREKVQSLTHAAQSKPPAGRAHVGRHAMSRYGPAHMRSRAPPPTTHIRTPLTRCPRLTRATAVRQHRSPTNPAAAQPT